MGEEHTALEADLVEDREPARPAEAEPAHAAGAEQAHPETPAETSSEPAAAEQAHTTPPPAETSSEPAAAEQAHTTPPPAEAASEPAAHEEAPVERPRFEAVEQALPEALLAETPVAVADLVLEPDYPPPNSVPVPPPPISLRVYPAPVVEEISPASGSMIGGTKLSITGAGLFRASIVRIGGVIAQTIGADEPRELRVLTPESPRAGEVDITIENPFLAPAVVAKAFRYEALAAPHVTSVSPDHVATKGGTELTVNGDHFVKTTVVLFDGKPAEGARFVSATMIDVKAPPGEDGKMVDVTVKNPDGQSAVARRAFVYDKRFG